MHGAPAIPEEVCSLLAGKAGRRQGGKAGGRASRGAGGEQGGGEAEGGGPVRRVRGRGSRRGRGLRWGVGGAAAPRAAAPAERSSAGAGRSLPLHGFGGSLPGAVPLLRLLPPPVPQRRRQPSGALLPFPSPRLLGAPGTGKERGLAPAPGLAAGLSCCGGGLAARPPVRVWAGARCAGPPQSCAGGVEVLRWQACVEGGGRQSGPVALLLTAALAAGGSFSLSGCCRWPGRYRRELNRAVLVPAGPFPPANWEN